MTLINRILLSVVSILFLTGCCNCIYKVTVSNPYDVDRLPEMVELDMSSLDLLARETYYIQDNSRREVPFQETYDGKLIFQVSLKGGEEQTYRICKGIPSQFDSYVQGRHYHDKEDDFAWESDKAGFRMYGHKQDVASGYDLFCKRGTDRPVLDTIYSKVVDGAPLKARLEAIRAIDEEAAYAFDMDSVTIHVDHGYGMDVYAVGPTLGAGIAALMDNETISYPYCYETWDIFENGPLRFTAGFTFRPIACGEDNEVLETRIISIDAGSYLNRTAVSYANLSSPKEIVAGIVLREDGGQWAADVEKGYISYPAPTQNFDTRKEVDNGTIYVGHVYPDGVKVAHESHGHILTRHDYTPGSEFVYYWGSGWDHADMLTHEQWNTYLETFAFQTRNPLEIKIN